MESKFSLSLAGKQVLIKAVATAVPTYPMMCFKFPKSLCNDINDDLAKFCGETLSQDLRCIGRLGNYRELVRRKEA